jgi:hypothetical protein
MKEHVMGGACSTHGTEDNLKERDQLGDIDVDERIILIRSLRK